MRSVRFAAAMSLDGYIAGPNGESDWIDMDPEIDFRGFMSEFDTILMGRKTYQAAKSRGAAGMPGIRSIVVSRTLAARDCPGATLCSDPAKIVSELRAKPGKDIWLFGGGKLFASMLDLRLVDSIELALIPVVLGSGIPLLPSTKGKITLELKNRRLYPKTGTLFVEYAPII